MDTIPCPGCRTPLEPSATVCPICLRPRGKLEITRAYATLREMKKQRQIRPFILTGRVLAAAAAAALLFRYRVPILDAAVSARARVARFTDESLYPPAPKQAAAPPEHEFAPVPAQTSAFPAPQAAPRPAFSTPEPAPAPAQAQVQSTAAKAPRSGRVEDLPFPAFDQSTQWVFYGRIFDVITLSPVSGVQLTFKTVGESRGRYPAPGGSGATMGGYPSDAEGRFVFVLPRLPDGLSYELHASHARYASSPLYESDIPYATLPVAERRDMSHNAQDGDMTLPPLIDIAGEEAVRRDVFLAPRR